MWDAKAAGGQSAVWILGGGSPKNFVLQTEPQIQEVLGIAEKGHDYFLQLTDARPDTGGLSGATPAEAVSWGKIDPDQLPGTVICYADATIALPLLTSYALARREKRPLKRLYDRRERADEAPQGCLLRARPRRGVHGGEGVIMRARSGAPRIGRLGLRAGATAGARSAEEAGAGAGKPKKKGPKLSAVWRESRELVWQHRKRLAIGLVLMLIGRASGLVLPWTSKLVIDDVIGQKRVELIPWIALGAGGATVLQAVTGFALTLILGVAAQRAITDMRRRIQEHVTRLPIRYFDSTQTGVLISRIMNDAEGIRNLVGTGLVELTGGVVTAAAAFAVLCYLNWKLTLVNLVILGMFGGAMALCVQHAAPAVPRALGEATRSSPDASTNRSAESAW